MEVVVDTLTDLLHKFLLLVNGLWWLSGLSFLDGLVVALSLFELEVVGEDVVLLSFDDGVDNVFGVVALFDQNARYDLHNVGFECGEPHENLIDDRVGQHL